MTSLHVWTAFTLFLVKWLEDTEFDGGIFTWSIVFTVIIVFILTAHDSSADNLLTDNVKFQKVEEFEK